MGKMSENEKTQMFGLVVIAFMVGIFGVMNCGNNVIAGTLTIAFLVLGGLGVTILWSQREKPEETLITNDAGVV